MKKRVVRLNETELTRLVERIVKRVNKKPLRESRNRKRFVRESNEMDSYEMTLQYPQESSTSSFDDYYDEEAEIEEVLVTVDIPKSLFQQISGIDSKTMKDETQVQYEIWTDIGERLMRYVIDKYNKGEHISCTNQDGVKIDPDFEEIDIDMTPGVVTVFGL